MAMGTRFPPHVFFAFGIAAFIFVSFVLYSSVDSSDRRRLASYNHLDAPEVAKLKEKLDDLGKEVQLNEKYVNDLDEKLNQLAKEHSDNLQKVDPGAPEGQAGFLAPPPASPAAPPQNVHLKEDDLKAGGNKVQVVHKALKAAKSTTPSRTFVGQIAPASGTPVCPATGVAHEAESDVQMLHAYELIPFDNPDGGVWKQGWEITYDKEKIQQEKKLEVVVLPHSHCDPGWIQTFEGYYETQTKHILDGMAKHLGEKTDMKFIYAEMSFFELWWSQQTDETRSKVKEYLKNGQFEIVSGGWVMTDEANAHLYSIVMEAFEGHEFIKNQMGYEPRNHWSIDPFGISPTLAQVMKAANLSHMAIQRVHYSVKKYLAKNRQLEFRWRQLFAGKSSKTDIMTHMFPFYSYDVPHTCGPDPKVCCQFDFRRMSGIGCPWGKQPVRINSKNVAVRAELIADQYRKKAQLYSKNVLLVPLGDDFRYDTNAEWDDQYNNYRQLFDYMNKQADWNINARFGTLDDYFKLLESRLAEEADPKQKELPALSGDFFTYADRDDHYWSGYFTSRPFYKHIDRTLQHYLRTADIVYSLAHWKQTKNPASSKFAANELYDGLVEARRALSLFQHHDGVTGTAKDHVVVDYAEKMLAAINTCKAVIARASEYLMKFPLIRDEQGLKVDEEHYSDKLPRKIVSEDGSSVVVFNSLPTPRDEVTCLHVNSWKSRIGRAGAAGSAREDIPQQLGPVLHVKDGKIVIDKERFELCFLASIRAFGFQRYEIFEADDTSHKVRISASTDVESSFFEVQPYKADSELKLKNGHVEATFDSHTGYLKAVSNAKKLEAKVELGFVRYGARGHNPARRGGGDSLSGAYLFLPDGPAKEVAADDNAFVLVEGAVRSFLFVKGPESVHLVHQVRLDTNAQSLQFVNTVNITSQSNFELAMRLKSDITNDKFFTDLNGYQMIRRRRFAKLPIQAQFYPMPGAAFVESDGRRLSLIGRQALGVASLEPGWIEVMLDRRLEQDDDRGLVQGVQDNKLTESQFRLLLEQLTPQSDKGDSETIGYHSLPAHFASLGLHYPMVTLVGQMDHASSSEVLASYSGLSRALPCDINALALRTLSEATVYSGAGGRSTKPQSAAALVLQRLGVECRTQTPLLVQCDTTGGKLDVRSTFEETPKSVVRSSLTILQTTQDEAADISLDPMDLQTVKVTF